MPTLSQYLPKKQSNNNLTESTDLLKNSQRPNLLKLSLVFAVQLVLILRSGNSSLVHHCAHPFFFSFLLFFLLRREEAEPEGSGGCLGLMFVAAGCNVAAFFFLLQAFFSADVWILAVSDTVCTLSKMYKASFVWAVHRKSFVQLNLDDICQI